MRDTLETPDRPIPHVCLTLSIYPPHQSVHVSMSRPEGEGGRVWNQLPGTHPRLDAWGQHAPTRSGTPGSSPRSSRSSCRGLRGSGAMWSSCSSKSCRAQDGGSLQAGQPSTRDPPGPPASPPVTQQPLAVAPHPVRIDQLPHSDVHHGLGHSHHVRILIHRKALLWLWHLAGAAHEPPAPKVRAVPSAAALALSSRRASHLTRPALRPQPPSCPPASPPAP